jgi:hypothetical protein
MVRRFGSAWFALARILLASCGGDDGVKLGEFLALSATGGDPRIALKAPGSASPASFSYDSSDLGVATVAGDKLTIVGPGTSTITARVCAEPSVKQEGVCVAPVTTAAYVPSGALTWMPATGTVAWATADTFCKTTKINGSTGWRLATRFELTALVASGQLAGKGWNLVDTWTSNAGAAEKTT